MVVVKNFVENVEKILRKCTVAFKTQGLGPSTCCIGKTAGAGEGAKQRAV